MAKYTEDQTQQIEEFINSYNGGEIPREALSNLANSLEVEVKSLAPKIRFMGGKIEKTVAKPKLFSEKDEKRIRKMTANPDKMPFLEEIAKELGKEPKQVRGKLVSMRISGVKKRDVKQPTAKAFSEADEAVILEMTKDPENMPFIEEIAERLNADVKKLRGKIASMKIKGVTSNNTKAPKAKIYTDELKEELKVLVTKHSVEEIAKMKNLNFVGLRSILGKMGLLEKKQKQVYWTTDRVAELTKYVNEGKDYKEIAELMNKNALVIAKKIKQIQATDEAA